ncbi:hypothetical protein DL95DRAFT_52064 [Leptodontidium sp. 2 PMI_412]|nr:hypothetical protein DL95DRAFT_52064 [Leptodontidium sp. 2 PMI_412]
MSISLPTSWTFPFAAAFSLFYTANAQSNCTNLNGPNSAFLSGVTTPQSQQLFLVSESVIRIQTRPGLGRAM